MCGNRLIMNAYIWNFFTPRGNASDFFQTEKTITIASFNHLISASLWHSIPKSLVCQQWVLVLIQYIRYVRWIFLVFQKNYFTCCILYTVYDLAYIYSSKLNKRKLSTKKNGKNDWTNVQRVLTFNPYLPNTVFGVAKTFNQNEPLKII